MDDFLQTTLLTVLTVLRLSSLQCEEWRFRQSWKIAQVTLKSDRCWRQLRLQKVLFWDEEVECEWKQWFGFTWSDLRASLMEADLSRMVGKFPKTSGRCSLQNFWRTTTNTGHQGALHQYEHTGCVLMCCNISQPLRIISSRCWPLWLFISTCFLLYSSQAPSWMLLPSNLLEFHGNVKATLPPPVPLCMQNIFLLITWREKSAVLWRTLIWLSPLSFCHVVVSFNLLFLHWFCRFVLALLGGCAHILFYITVERLIKVDSQLISPHHQWEAALLQHCDRAQIVNFQISFTGFPVNKEPASFMKHQRN